ncbi:hypothetical protein Q7P37_006489 [Cladosporium fusiforme]
MSSSIPIPTSRNKAPAHRHAASSSSLSSYHSSGTPSSSYASSGGASFSPHGLLHAGVGKGKGKEREVAVVPRRQSLLGNSLSKSEHTVVDLGHGGAPRLVSCVKSSQGFDWNQELFLPSYADYESQDLERKQDPVEDIVLTEEEIAAMFPQ